MRYLIVKTSALGDIVQSFAVLAYLKSKFPTAHIDWVVEKRFSSLVEAHPLIDRVICIDSKSWRRRLWHWEVYKEIASYIRQLRMVPYDAVFDLQGNAKSALVSLCAKTKVRVGFGWKTASEKISACVNDYKIDLPLGHNVRQEYLYLVQSFFKEPYSFYDKPVFLNITSHEKDTLSKWPSSGWMICPGSQWKNKKLPLRTLEQLLDRLYDSYKPQFVFLSGSDKELHEVTELSQKYPGALIADRLSIPLLQHLMAKMQLVISVDSFALHLAEAAGVPTFGIFGPSASSKYAPLTVHSASYQGRCPYGKTFERRCPLLRTCATGACLHEADPEGIYAVLQEASRSLFQ